MLARDYCTSGKKPIVLSSHMIGGLKKDCAKMSKSDPDSAIFMEDSAEDVCRKINKSFCPEGEVEGNRTLEFVEYFAFKYFNHFIIEREEKYGGKVSYTDYKQFLEDYKDKKIAAPDVKMNLSRYINNILEPVRQHFQNDPKAKKLYAMVQAY